ncbi:MAG: hypothetical protein J6Y37_12805, partial [Paludibacteraceae bacterium]|nr:hypothetical protein [Paludibacteraceae bacterium]
MDELMYSNPKTALSKVDTIEKQAKLEGNAPQQIRCIISRGNAQCFIDNSAFFQCLAEMKTFQEKTNDEVARSVATYMIGKLYLSYYDRNSYSIKRRTNLDYVPEDIAEWTSNLFIDKIRECSFAALSNEKLKTVPSIDYEPILEKGEDSRIYRPTLYDLFLSDLLKNYGTDDILSREETEKYLKEWVAFHAKDKERDAYVHVKLRLLTFLHEGKSDRAPIISELEALLKEVKNDRASILVRIDLCNELKGGVSLEELPEDSKLPQRLKNICDEGIKAFPKHKKINGLKQVVEELMRPSVLVSVKNKAILSSDKVRLEIRYANMKQVKMELYRVEASSMYDYYEDRQKGLSYPCLQTFTFDLPKSNYCVKREKEVELPALDYGIYRIKLLANDGVDCVTFSVSDLYSMENHVMKDGETFSEYVVVDAKTGAPKPKVNLLFRSYVAANTPKTIANAVTDDSGFATLPLKSSSQWMTSAFTYFEDGKDRFKYPDSYALTYGNAHASISDNAGSYLSIFTDRSIYRPSQTVYYKVVAYNMNRKSVEILSDEEMKVMLYDANYQVIAEQNLKTNEFGSISSSFVLPEGGLSGCYRIEVRSMGRHFYNDTKMIRVEEYKRPTFEAKMTVPSNSFSFGDTITVKGRADYLLGMPASGAEVDYTVVRKPCSWWWFYTRIEEKRVAEGSCTVADDGSFDIPFLAQKDETDKELSYYHYEVRAKVTDANGETHEAVISLSVGDRSLFFSADAQGNLLMDDFVTKQYRVANLNGEGQVVNVSYEVLRDDVSVAKGSCLSDKTGAFSLKVETQAWPSGAYKVNLKALDERGREVTASYEMVLYRKEDKCPPVHTILWAEDVKSVELPYGEEYKVRIGSSLKEAHLLLLVRDEHGEVEKRWIDLSNEIKEFSFKLEEKNGENLNVKFFLVNEAVCHEKEFSIKKKEESKALPVKLSVFRDKMKPGSKETWTLTLPKDKQAEVLAAMYDASLDQLYPQSWSFSPLFSRWCRFSSWQNGGGGWTEGNLYYEGDFSVQGVFWTFDEFMNLPMGYSRMRKYTMGSALFGGSCLMVEDEAVPMKSLEMAAISSDDAMVEYASAPMAQNNAMFDSATIDEGDVSAQNDAKAPEPQVRENFAETAFFYPQLTTDKEGNVQFSFEMPESLTRWNFKALAHTKDLFFGQMSAQMVTQKDFMISPNLPRFLRKGDRCVLSAKVINLSESEVKGTALMEFLDPVTEKV